MFDEAVVLACDVGASRVKTGLVDARGRLQALAERAVPVERGEDGRSELDPDLWWAAFLETAAEVADRAPVVAVAICGLTRTQVLDRGEAGPRGPAITWRDTRAAAVAREVAAGAPEPIDAFHPVARLAWIERHEPGRLAPGVVALDPKDWIGRRLTGVRASDPVSMARLVAGAAGPTARFAAYAPKLLVPGDVLGRVMEGYRFAGGRLAGSPVVMASHDTWCSVVGMGAMRAGSAYAICGTSDVAGAVADRPAAAPGLLAVPWGERLHQLGGPSSNGADVAPWLARLTGATDLDALLTAPRASRPALFLPYLSGERAPYWDADLRGAFLGLDRSHGPADLAWAVVEGSALWLADVIARAEAALGFAAPEVRIAGGGTRSAIWNQVRADALGKTIAVAADEPGLVGCAALAFVALGRFPDLDAAQKAMAAPAARFTPDPTRHAAYRTLAELHRRAVEAVGPLSRDLGQVALPPTTPPR